MNQMNIYVAIVLLKNLLQAEPVIKKTNSSDFVPSFFLDQTVNLNFNGEFSFARSNSPFI